jgi:hypothetical protein
MRVDMKEKWKGTPKEESSESERETKNEANNIIGKKQEVKVVRINK